MELAPALLVGLYEKDLVKEPTVAAPAGERKTDSREIGFLGKNARGIVVLVRYENDVYLPEPQLQFLTSILAACQLNLGDVAIINTAKQPVAPTSIAAQFQPKFLLGFGIDASAIGYPESALLSTCHLDGMQVVWSPAAETLNGSGAESKALKSKLWLCLKAMFNV